MQLQKINRVYVPYISLAGMLLALGGLGYLGFLAFVRNMLMPSEFAAYGLVITAVAAGTASFYRTAQLHCLCQLRPECGAR